MMEVIIKLIILTTCFLKICAVVLFILDRHQQRSYNRLKNRTNNSFPTETGIVLSLQMVHLYRNMLEIRL
jgi:hypothetical protein